nr:MAG TPA: hypothetical protein [Bacteriophage sp.]DAI57959.1 MAG TPA: hypothetical protein [Caudoviricetes sp.]DAM64054.1 MAG TPA: hypothetical protein [Crassvirales sp.]DAQ87972.1 MAG TPA: hypothetical protein [Caudoviricetes sp.]
MTSITLVYKDSNSSLPSSLSKVAVSPRKKSYLT